MPLLSMAAMVDRALELQRTQGLTWHDAHTQAQNEMRADLCNNCESVTSPGYEWDGEHEHHTL